MRPGNSLKYFFHVLADCAKSPGRFCFAFAWGLAKAQAADRMEAEAYRMEAEAYRRAVEGVVRRRKIGDQIVEYRGYSDNLLMFLLKGERPQKFRDDGLESRLSVEEARTWTPEMISSYRAEASLEECRLVGRVLHTHASDPARGAITDCTIGPERFPPDSRCSS